MKRNHTIDLLKALAGFGVIVIHTAAGALAVSIGSFRWYRALFLGVLFRASVPVFLMCSGALFLDPEADRSIQRMYTRYLPKILISFFVWRLIYAAAHQQGYLYYLQMLLLFYAVVPILRVLTRGASRKELQYALCLWFLLGILYPTARNFPPFSQAAGIPQQWALNMAWSALGYGLLGHYFSRFKLPLSAGICLFLVGFVLTFAATALLSLRQQQLWTGFLEGMSVGVALMAAGAWGICSHVPGPCRTAAFLSKRTFCVFLTHCFFLNCFPFRSILICAALDLACCLAVHGILSKIPVVNKWLI